MNRFFCANLYIKKTNLSTIKTNFHYFSEETRKWQTKPRKNLKEKVYADKKENVKLYCPSNKNENTCPFAENCIFLHQNSKC